MPQLQTTHEESEHRYVVTVDGEPAGSAYYRLGDGVVEFTHTGVDDRFEGQGVGSSLARAALDDVRRDGRRHVVASCPFIASWIDRHADYQDLLAG